MESSQRGTVENVAIYNNLILHTDNGIIISDAGEGGPRKDIRIYNNTVYEGSHDWFDGIHVLTPEVEGIVIRNNIVVSQIHVGNILAMSSAVAAKITADHNLVFGPTGCLENHPQCVDLSELAGNTTADPMFANSLAGDVHLRAGVAGDRSGDCDTGSRRRPRGRRQAARGPGWTWEHWSSGGSDQARDSWRAHRGRAAPSGVAPPSRAGTPPGR